MRNNNLLPKRHATPSDLLEPDAGPTRTSGSEGAGVQQCAPATRLTVPYLSGRSTTRLVDAARDTART